MTTFSALDKMKEAEREARLRRQVYPRFVVGGKITPREAERQIALMDAIAADYRKLAEQDAGPLFNG